MSGTRTAPPPARPGGRGDDPLYERAKTIAHDGDAAARRKLAGRRDAAPEILYYLAEDPEADVRRAIAGNACTPIQADLILARDIDGTVRQSLVEKISRLVPGLTSEAQGKLRDAAIEVIEILARDELPRVRAILAQALAEVTGAPPPQVTRVVKRLAGDDVLEVAAPVLERSELLTDEDLIEIIRGGPVEGALSAIACRSAVAANVAEAIAVAEDEQAIAVLLGNPSAQIREETLDRIVDRAPEVETWHDPLVRRPKLPASAARRIAGFVADTLLEVLRRREDLDPETARAVEKAVKRRLDESAGKGGKKAAKAEKKKKKRKERKAAEEAKGEESPLDRARRLHKQGKLVEQTVARAVSSGDRAFVDAALAVLSELPLPVVREIVASGSAKAVTSLAWRAGLKMRFAVELQMRHAGILPRSVLYAHNGFDYPLSEEDMQWQIEFFGG